MNIKLNKKLNKIKKKIEKTQSCLLSKQTNFDEMKEKNNLMQDKIKVKQYVVNQNKHRS